VRKTAASDVDPREMLKAIRLSDSDRDILRSMEPVVDGIAELFGRNCEVILHSFEDMAHSVVRIANAYITGRKIGSPITDLGLNALRESFAVNRDIVGSYFTRSESGKLFKSITILIRNRKSDPIGMLCVNMDISAPLSDFLSDFAPDLAGKEHVVEHFHTEIGDLVHASLNECMTQFAKTKGVSASEKNRMIIAGLARKGIFDIKGAIDIVAKEIGVSKYTIYHYLREVKNRQ
jgi:predicted transcriptional regulator YheO